MKKIMSVIIAVGLFASLLLAGCSDKKDDGNSNGGSSSKSMKIAYLANGSMGDKSFFESALEGVKEIEKTYGAKVTPIEIGTDKSKFEPALLDASEDDYDIIIIGTFDMEQAILKVAPQFPDKKYIMFDYELDYSSADLSNVYCVTYKANEGAYLSGVLAASMTKTNKIGFVGGMDIPLINDFLVGYIQGAKDANPDIKVLVSYVGDFNDPAKGKELALAQYNQGADIVYQGAGQSGLGCLDAAKEKNKFIIGTDSDQAMIYKDDDAAKANLILTSQLKRVDKSLVRAFELYQKNELKFGAGETLGIKEDAVELADNEFYKKLVPAEVRAKIDETEKKISDGTIKVNSGFGLSTEQLNEIKNSVK